MFSIIIPTYNYARYLPRAIESVLAQRGDDCELVIVDDGSSDQTADIVKGYFNKLPGKITYVFQENRGPSAAKNRGISLSKGEYALFLDADDALLPDAMDRFRHALQTYRKVDFIWAGRVYQALDGNVKRRPPGMLSSDKDENFVRYVRGQLGRMNTGSWIAHKRVFAEIQFPESIRMYEDSVFHAHLLARFHGVSIPESVIKIYRHRDSLSHNVELMQSESLKTVDFVFDPRILPHNLMPYRTEGFSLRCLAMFLFYYRAGLWQQAKEIYSLGIQTFPRNLLRVKYLRKYLWGFLRSTVTP